MPAMAKTRPPCPDELKARIMAAAGLRGVSRRRFEGSTERDARQRPVLDPVQWDFSAEGPNRLWVADVTYVPCWAGWLYLAIVLDAFSRRVVGCAYALAEWERLLVFLDDPRIEIGNNAVDRHIWSIAVGRNDWLFCRSGDGGRCAALAYALIESAKAAGVEALAYPCDLLERLAGLPGERAAEFTLRAWAALRPR